MAAAEAASRRKPVAELTGDATAAGGANARRQYDDAIAKLNQFFDDARRYKNTKAANPAGFVPDLKMEAMIPVLDGKTPMAVSASTSDSIHDAIQFADKQHEIVIMGPREVGAAGAELKAHNIPVILGRVLALPEREDDSYDEAMALPSKFYKAGVKFAFGTFTNEFVRNIPYQAAAAVAFGLPADEALKAVTINPAEIWGQADKIGSVEKGKWADLIITNGDLLEIQTKIEHVYIKGKEVDLSNKQTKLLRQVHDSPVMQALLFCLSIGGIYPDGFTRAFVHEINLHRSPEIAQSLPGPDGAWPAR